MANFKKKFGIKEVADVAFYPVNTMVGEVEQQTVQVDEATGAITLAYGAKAALVFDSLKVSTLEMTAEQSEARGGKGNPPLIIWDYGREVNVTLEDALLSMECLEAMFGDATTSDNVITVNANKFPGVYTVVGQTFARDVDGTDHLFTFYIPKAKIQSENTITMEAEGDPTVFNLSLRVLRGNEQGDMVKFILQQNTAANTTPSINLPGASTADTDVTTHKVTFVKADGTVTQFEVAAGGTVTAPTNTEGMEWDPAVTTVTANAVYTEKTKAAG